MWFKKLRLLKFLVFFQVIVFRSFPTSNNFWNLYLWYSHPQPNYFFYSWYHYYLLYFYCFFYFKVYQINFIFLFWKFHLMVFYHFFQIFQNILAVDKYYFFRYKVDFIDFRFFLRFILHNLYLINYYLINQLNY